MAGSVSPLVVLILVSAGLLPGAAGLGQGTATAQAQPAAAPRPATAAPAVTGPHSDRQQRSDRVIRVRGARLVDDGRVVQARIRWSSWLRDKPGPGQRHSLRLVGDGPGRDASVVVTVTSGGVPPAGWTRVSKRLSPAQARTVAVSDEVVLTASQQYDDPRDRDRRYEANLVTTITLDPPSGGQPPGLRDCRGIAIAPGSDLSRCALAFADLGMANLTGADLSGADLTGARMRGVDLERAALVSTTVIGADLGAADVRRATVRSADLTGAHLRLANFLGSDLSGATLRRVNAIDAVFVQANLSGATLASASLRWSSLSDANLDGANLASADLRIADLRRTSLRGTSLASADLTKAILRGASMDLTDLQGADLSLAEWIDGRTCAQGSVGACR